jgi:class 3 adenylate cyclase/tetratricopeptide (TPR) repeat protein
MPKSENLTVLITDIVGFTAKMSNSTRANMRTMLRLHDRLLKRTVQFYGGQYIKSTGDGMLAIFRGTTNAVQCGMAIQDTIAEYNLTRPEEEQLRVRAALNLGEVDWTSRNDIAGEAVNITARIEEITPADEIYISGTVHQTMNKAEVPSEFVDNIKVKGIGEAIAIHRIPRGQTRLVVTGEPLDAGSGRSGLPYGGMPRPSAISTADRIRGTLGKGWVISVLSAVIAIFVLVAIAWHANWMSPEAEQAVARVLTNPLPDIKALPLLGDNRQLLRRGKTLLDQGKLDELRDLLAKSKPGDPAHAEALLLQGHLLFEEKDLGKAVARYAEGLAADPELRADERLARNLVAALGHVSRPAIDLIRKYNTETMNEYLARRTSMPGPGGRGQAVSLLQSLGQEGRIDYYQHGLLGLGEAKSCDDHKLAIASLRRSGDRRGIAALQQARGEGPVAWMRSLCWADDAEAAIVALSRNAS